MPCDTQNSDVPEKFDGAAPEGDSGRPRIAPSGFPGRWIPGTNDATRRGVGLGHPRPEDSNEATTKADKLSAKPGSLGARPDGKG